MLHKRAAAPEGFTQTKNAKSPWMSEGCQGSMAAEQMDVAVCSRGEREIRRKPARMLLSFSTHRA